MGQNQQNLGHFQTTMSQARNKLLTNFQRLESTTIHGHMVCVKKSDMGMTKKWGKINKIWAPSSSNISSLILAFDKLSKATINY